MFRGFVSVGVVVFLALSVVPTFSQGTSASIIGRITDQTGAVLPGVTVTATSPALQVPQMTAVTNELGEYRLAPLPIGTFEVSFDLQGFAAARRQDIRLTVGFTARLDVVLGVASVGETVTVSGAAPIVDVATTSGSTMLTNEQLQLSATARNSVMSVLTMAPGVRTFSDVGGGQMMLENPTPRAYGIGGAGSQWYTIDGVQNYRLGTTFWDYQTFDEVRVQSTGADAERPTRGVQVTAVVKSGGNEFHGGGLWAGTNSSFQGNNIDSELEAAGITSGDALDSQYDVSGEIGGRIVRNKLWFYSAVRKRRAAYDVLNNFQADGSPGQTINNQRIFTNKLSFQANTAQRFIFMNMWEHGEEQKGLSELVRYEAREFKTNDRPNTKGEWEWSPSGGLIANLQLGHSRQDGTSPFLNTPQIVGRSDLDTEVVAGDNVVAGETSWAGFYHSTGSLTYYKANWGGGNHEFKTGFDYGHGSTEVWGLTEKDFNYHLRFASGVPDSVAFFNAPIQPHRNLRILGSYVRDNWTMGRMTLNLGVRYGHEAVSVPAGCRDAASGPSSVIFPARCFDEVNLPTWNYLVPRISAAYDLSGDGKTVVKGGYGRFGYMREEALPRRYDPNSIGYAVFQWHDLNRNNNWEPGETNLNTNGPDFIESTGHEFAAIAPNFVPNPDEKQVMYDELSVNFERELMPNFGLRVTGIYTRTINVQGQLNRFRPFEAYNIPVTNRDPGPDGRLGTADDGGMVTYFEYSPALQGARFEEFTPVVWPDSAANQSFKTIEVATVKRLSNRWQMVASYSATKKDWPIGAAGLARGTGFGTSSPTFSAAGDNAGYLTPNALINTSDETWDWDAKIAGTYILPREILASATYHHTSGDAFARQVRFTGGRTIPTITLNVDPIGTYRRPDVALVNFRLEKRFTLPRAQIATVTLNLYNALNANTVTGLQNRSGASFLQPLSILPPRLAEIGLAYRF
jgi:carboxypeptidase family protein